MQESFNIFENDKLRGMQARHPDWIWNRADTHVILSVPRAPEPFKTPVEPGNSFSPGPGTFGVSTWVMADGTLYAPEQMPLADLTWRFEGGFYPVLHACWQAGALAMETELFADGDTTSAAYDDWYAVRVRNTAQGPVNARIALPFRSFGAAGGPITALAAQDGCVLVNGHPACYPDDLSFGFGAVSYAETGEDIGQLLRRGEVPTQCAVQDDSTWASGALWYDVRLAPGEEKRFSFCFPLHVGQLAQNRKAPQRPLPLAAHREKLLADWHDILSIQLSLPDQRFTEALQCQLTHLYMFTVDSAIRICPISYPIWWLRDGVYVLNALNKGGLHAFGEASCRHIAPNDAFGGFGAEGDGPSDGIWALSEHFLLTRDMDYLRDMFPHIARRAALLMQMRRTEVPLHKFTEFVIPKMMLSPETDVMCLAAQDGLIVGRMDHHLPLFWINGFAYLAMKRAALCARALSLDDAPYEREAGEILAALRRKVPEAFGKNDRDVNSAFWPADWATPDDPLIQQRFDEFWQRVRCPDGQHVPEPEWTYFEAGQAHNYVLLGQRERAWVSIEHFLTHHTAPGLYTYLEAIGNTALLWPRTRGWDDSTCVTPHGWTAAELFLLLRDCLAREQDDALVIGMGIPASWRDKPFEVTGLPTYFDLADFAYDPATATLRVKTQRPVPQGVRSALPFDVTVVQAP